MTNKQASETDRFLKALRGQHSSIADALGDEGLYGAMSNYTGQSHLIDALTESAIANAATGAGTGLLAGGLLLPVLGIQRAPVNYFKASGTAGLAAGLGLGALSAIAKYYLGKGAAGIGQE